MNLLFVLIISSVVGSVALAALLQLRPITGKMFSKTWHYYSLLVPLVFLLGGSHVAVSLIGLIPQSATMSASVIPVAQKMPVDIGFEFIRPPMFDGSMINMPMRDVGADVAFSAPPSVTSQLMTYLQRVSSFILAVWTLGAILFIAASTKKYLQTDVWCCIKLKESILTAKYL